jgi:hypothetical protein
VQQSLKETGHWQVFRSQGALHRIIATKGVIDSRGEIISKDPLRQLDLGGACLLAQTACGRLGPMMIPGIFSCLGLARCKQCCDDLNIPYGRGTPNNSGILEPL